MLVVSLLLIRDALHAHQAWVSTTVLVIVGISSLSATIGLLRMRFLRTGGTAGCAACSADRFHDLNGLSRCDCRLAAHRIGFVIATVSRTRHHPRLGERSSGERDGGQSIAGPVLRTHGFLPRCCLQQAVTGIPPESLVLSDFTVCFTSCCAAFRSFIQAHRDLKERATCR